jgi:FlaA1/EpsC-like NDP-sugar epimerase
MAKRCLVVLVDCCTSFISIWLAFILRLEEIVPFSHGPIYSGLVSITLLIPLFTVMGLYRPIFRFSNSQTIDSIVRAIAVYSLGFGIVVIVIGLPQTPRSIGIIHPILLFLGVSSSRLIARYLLQNSQNRSLTHEVKRVAVYGAGAAGSRTATIINQNPQFKLVGFIDDDHTLTGSTLNGVRIFSRDSLNQLKMKHNVSLVFLAITNVPDEKRTHIIQDLMNHRLLVRTLPSVAEIATGRFSLTEIRDLDIGYLLGRRSINPDLDLLAAKIRGKTVVISGAGGSIGSELAKQILLLKPAKLILVELSEFALYAIESELLRIQEDYRPSIVTKIITILGSTGDYRLVHTIFATWKVDTVYHAAAYKHVSLVERNICSGVANNIFGTYAFALAASRAGVSDFLLISSDKAVRPANVMGATKRVSEMILQALDSEPDSKTIFSMVRFGNVLGSSGSVIPKFQKQIENGGPVTVTHKEVTRYFMTVKEAAELVIQASALAQGGDVFVLDMGKPVKIIDLARAMIELSGLSESGRNLQSSGVEIEIIGLQPGEKLHEELLFETSPEKTRHPKITRDKDRFLSWQELLSKLDELTSYIEKHDVKKTVEWLEEIVDGYSAPPTIPDTGCQANNIYKNVSA